MYEVVRDPGWPEYSPDRAPKAMEIDTLASGSSGKSKRSEVTVSVAGMVTLSEPANLSATSDVVSMLEPVVALATWTAVIVTGAVPYSFESRRRSWLPPIETRTIWRSV